MPALSQNRAWWVGFIRCALFFLPLWSPSSSTFPSWFGGQEWRNVPANNNNIPALCIGDPGLWEEHGTHSKAENGSPGNGGLNHRQNIFCNFSALPFPFSSFRQLWMLLWIVTESLPSSSLSIVAGCAAVLVRRMKRGWFALPSPSQDYKRSWTEHFSPRAVYISLFLHPNPSPSESSSYLMSLISVGTSCGLKELPLSTYLTLHFVFL